MEIDLAAMAKGDNYSKAKEDMFRFTHPAASPWTAIRTNDKRRTRLEAIRSVLYALDYDGKTRARWSPSPRHRSLVRVPIIFCGMGQT